MKRPAAICVVFIMLSVTIFPGSTTLPGQRELTSFESEIDKILALPEDKIDVGFLCLTLAKDFFPEIDTERYSAMLDRLANEIRLKTNGSADPDYRIRVMNTCLYRENKFGYELSDMQGKKLENRFLHGLLDKKKGSCANLPLLYLALAQRLGYPVYPSFVPDHIFCRYEDDSLKMKNIEATSGGGYSSDEQYITDFQIPERGIISGAYPRTITRKELVAHLVCEMGITHGLRGNHAKAVRYLEKGLKFYPRLPDAWRNLGILYKKLGHLTYKSYKRDRKIFGDVPVIQFRIDEANFYFTRSKECFQKVDELGWAGPLTKP